MTDSQCAALESDVGPNAGARSDNEIISLGHPELKLGKGTDGVYFIDKTEQYCVTTALDPTTNATGVSSNDNNNAGPPHVAVEVIVKEHMNRSDSGESHTCASSIADKKSLHEKELAVEETEEESDLDFAARCMLTSMHEQSVNSQRMKQEWNEDELRLWQAAADFSLQCYQKAINSS